MYRGGYPEPFNDPNYEENCDDITNSDMLKVFIVIGMLVMSIIITILCQ